MYDLLWICCSSYQDSLCSPNRNNTNIRNLIGSLFESVEKWMIRLGNRSIWHFSIVEIKWIAIFKGCLSIQAYLIHFMQRCCSSLRYPYAEMQQREEQRDSLNNHAITFHFKIVSRNYLLNSDSNRNTNSRFKESIYTLLEYKIMISIIPTTALKPMLLRLRCASHLIKPLLFFAWHIGHRAWQLDALLLPLFPSLWS